MIGRVPLDVPAPGPDSAVRDWEDVLEALEHQVQHAEQLATTRSGSSTPAQPAPGDWVPPDLSVTMPPGLVDRARDLLARQAAVREDLAQALEDTRADLARSRRTTPGHRSQAPAYVDVSA